MERVGRILKFFGVGGGKGFIFEADRNPTEVGVRGYVENYLENGGKNVLFRKFLYC